MPDRKNPSNLRPIRCALFSLGLAAGLLASPAAAAERWISIGPVGGIVRQVAQSASDPMRLYAATEPSGLFRSRDGGRSWQSIDRGLEGVEVHELAVDPGNGDFVLASSGGAAAPQIWRSTNGGQSWTAALRPPFADGFTRGAFDLLFEPVSPGTVYAATAKGLFRSLDRGATWDSWALPQLLAIAIARDPAASAVWYTSAVEPNGANGAVYRSADGGNRWAPTLGLGGPVFDELPMQLFFRAGALYAVWSGGLYRSDDGATSWSLAAHLPTLPAFDFAFGPSGAIYAATATGVYSSTDGANWSPPEVTSADQAAPRDQIVDLAFVPGASGAPETVIAAGRRGLWRSADAGVSWRAASRGLAARTVGSLVAVLNAQGSVLSSLDEGIFRTDRTSDRWRRLPIRAGFEQPALAADPHHPGRVYALGGGGAVGVSEDLGTSWKTVGELVIDSVGLFRVDPVHPGILFASGSSNGSSGTEFTYRSVDGGATWEQILDEETLDLTFDPAHRNVGFRVLSGGGIDKTTNGGGSWRALPGLSGQLEGARPKSLLFDPRSRALYVGTDSRGVFRSTDGGRIFRRLATGLPRGTATGLNASVARLILDGGTALYAAVAERGVYRLDLARRWTAVNLGLPAGEFFGNLVADPGRPGRLYAGTASSSVWRLEER